MLNLIPVAYQLILNTCIINPLFTGNPLMGTLANSEDSDEMQHNAAFHQDLHCLLRLKQPSRTEKQDNLETSTCGPLKYKMDNPILIKYCINMYRKIHQNTKGSIHQKCYDILNFTDNHCKNKKKSNFPHSLLF